ncbi:MAG: cytochrome c [Bryobacteraceae bacterium]|nr:cytochrome c [Bryobacteraceae bacterium]
MFLSRIVFILAVGASLAPSHEVVTTKLTWSAEISRIAYRRCVTCHRENGSAPMPLVTYEQARPWAKAIRDEVLNRRMPPWGAIRGYGQLAEDHSLTQEEMTRIAEWVEGGAPEGDPKYLPDVPPVRSAPTILKGRRLGLTVLKTPAAIAGLKPLQSVDNAKIFARLPDGSIQPLIWLKNYNAKYPQTFLFSSDARLPAGTRIVSQPSVRVELIAR